MQPQSKRMLLPLLLLLWIPHRPFVAAEENVTTAPTNEVSAEDTRVLTASSQWEARWLGAPSYHIGPQDNEPQGNETLETATSQGDAQWLGAASYYRAGPGLCVRADGAEAKGTGVPLKNGPFPEDLCARICRVVPGCYGWTLMVYGPQLKEGTCVLFKEPTLRAGGEIPSLPGSSCWVRVAQAVKLGKSSTNELCRDVPLHLWCAENAGNKGLRLNTDYAGNPDVFVVRTERRGSSSRVCARRKDRTYGWGMQLEISCTPSTHFFYKENVAVMVGSSGSESKCVVVTPPLWCGINAAGAGARLNWESGDEGPFAVSVKGSDLCVRKRSGAGGWKSKLQILCNRGSQPELPVGMVPVAVGPGTASFLPLADHIVKDIKCVDGRVLPVRGAEAWLVCAGDAGNRGKRINPDFVGFKDAFDIQQSGHKAICAQRLDSKQGWALNLHLACRLEVLTTSTSTRTSITHTQTSTRTSTTRTSTTRTKTSTTWTSTTLTWTLTTAFRTSTTGTWTSATPTSTLTTATLTSSMASKTSPTRTSSTAMQTPTMTIWSPDTSTIAFEPLTTSTTEEGWEEAPLSVAPISTTMFIAGTTMRGDMSPRRRDTSPRRRDTSPRRRDTFPRRRDTSPRRRDTSPRRRDTSPRRRDTSPRRRDTSPRRRDTSPRRRDTSPRRRDTSPRRRDTSPRRRDTSPRRRDTSPRRRDTSPRRRDTSPRRRDTSPRRRNTPPRRRDTSPRRRDSSTTTSRKTSTSSRTTMTTTQTSTTSTVTGGSCPLLPRPTRLLSSTRRLENAYNTEMGQPYWVLQKISCPGRWDMYAVRGCNWEECDPQNRPPASRGQDITVSLAYYKNQYDHGSVTEYERQGATTKRKLDDLDTYNLIPFGGPSAFSPQGFQSNRQGSPQTVFWIDFHICRYNDRLVILKIGTGSRKDIHKTLKQEMEKGVGKSYYWCRPGSIQIYLFRGGSSKTINQKLEECLRSKFVPASEEKDVGEMRNGKIHPGAGKDQCIAACKDQSTLNFHSSMGCP